MGGNENEIRRETGREALRESGRRLKYSRVRYRRIFLVITDVLGMGGAPDAPEYGDAAADTVTRLAGSREKPDVPNLRNLGLFNMKRIPGVAPITYMMGRYMPLSRKSGGTDLAAGIRELMGILPEEGTDVSARKTAAGEGAEPAAPKTVPEALKEAGLDVIAAGSVSGVFGSAAAAECLCKGRGTEAMDRLLELAKRDFHGLCFADVGEEEITPAALERFDRWLGDFMQALNHNDLLLVTGVRGHDPASPEKDGTRERVPLVAWSPRFRTGGPLPGASWFCLAGATVCDNFGVKLPEGCAGNSRWDDFW